MTSVILGARTVEKLAGNLAAADVDLSAEEFQRLKDISQPRVGVYSYGPMAQEQRSRKIQDGRYKQTLGSSPVAGRGFGAVDC